jgi:4-hydroxyphenylacetate 3-monooxygenase
VPGAFHDTQGHTFQNYQAQIRLMVKLRFLAGVARRLTEAIGTAGLTAVREELGSIAAQAAMVEGMVAGMEARGDVENGAFVPEKHLMYAAQVLTQELYPRFVEKIRSLAGAALVMLPSSARDWDDPALARIIERTQRSPAMAPPERVRFLKLAWDALGSEFGSRQLQYEMFYAGARFVSCGHSWRSYDWDAAAALVDRLGAGDGGPSS